MAVELRNPKQGVVTINNDETRQRVTLAIDLLVTYLLAEASGLMPTEAGARLAVVLFHEAEQQVESLDAASTIAFGFIQGTLANAQNPSRGSFY